MTTMRKGQALIIILVVMSISLILGIAVSSRAISSIRQISFSDQAATALAFAEGGAEDGLKCLKDRTCTVPFDPPPFDLDGDGIDDFDYRITALGNSRVFDLPPIDRDRTVEVDLRGYPAGRLVNVHWVDEDNDDETADPPAIEITIIYCKDGGSSCPTGNFGIIRKAVEPNPKVGRSSGFSVSTPSGLFHNGVNYAYKSSIASPSGQSPISLRLKFLYSAVPASLAVEADSGILPVQGSRIESWGFSGRVVRKVEVTRTVNALSELFDYVLFSGSESVPLNK